MLEFLTLRPPAFGLDISDSSVKVVQLAKHNKGFQLASFGERTLPKGVVERGEIKKEEELSRTVAETVSGARGKKMPSRYVVASLPEEQAFLQVVQLPPMKEEEVRGAIYLQAENYVPYPLDTVYLDCAVIPPAKGKLTHMDVLVASFPRSVVDAYLAALQKAGLAPLVFEVEAIALARSFVENGVSPVPLLIVDIGLARTKISIFAGWSVRFTTSLPLSGAQFTQAVAKTLNKDEKKAEELKKQYGLAESGDPIGKEVFAAMVPTATDLVEQIRKYLEYYESHSLHEHLQKQKRGVEKIILCGGGANLKGLPEFFMKELRVEAVVGNPWVNILSAESADLPALSFQESLRYGTTLGLALRGATHD